ncbi:AI-2E family transporter [Paraburkholderia sp. DGU8]|uniref:AI-2E family transporter n=1 Tax=Paraburkholderia sp. DGU8 TaxID=3161997 RepID=UPI0034665E74
MTENPRKRPGFYILLVAVSVGLVWILLPYFSALLWGTVLAILFQPVQRRFVRLLGNHRTLAALATLALCVMLVIVPVGFVVTTLVQEITLVYQQASTGHWSFVRYFNNSVQTLPSVVQEWLGRNGIADTKGLELRITEGASRISQFVAAQALSIGQNTLQFAISLGIMLYLVFFLLRDGPGLSRRLFNAVPLDDIHKRKLLEKFTVVVRATVKGNLVVAAIQGLLGGLVFFALGIEGALLWGTLMAFLSLVPAIGVALVWVPAAIILVLVGSFWKAAALALFCLVVIGLVDNVLRPILVGKDTRLPDWIVLISTLGGISVFGVDGFIIGPSIAALFITCWDMSTLLDNSGPK